jgi:hypothetical protein
MSSPVVTQASGAPLATLTTTTETTALSTPGQPFNAPGAAGVLVQASVTGATGAAATSVQIRVRQGSGTSGNVVGLVNQVGVSASSFYQGSVSVLDTSPPSPLVYTVTVQQVSATGNGTVTLASIALETATASGA